MPFQRDDDAPWWVLENVPAHVLDDTRVPEMPAWLVEAPHTADAPDVDAWAPCLCAHCVPPEPGVVGCLTTAPESLAVQFESEWKRVQLHTARMWRAAAAMHASVLGSHGPAAAEHVGADLALITGLHPRTGLNLMITSLQAATEVPQLAELVEAGQLSSKHVDALLEEVGRWTDTPEQARAVLELTLDRARDRAAAHGWPTPGQLKKRLATTAILLDLTAAEKRKKSIHDRRGVSLFQTGAGQATLSIEGPDLPLVLAYDALRARAEAMGQLEGDTRSLDNRMYDAALELLAVDADGGDSLRPTTGLDGEPLQLVVRGIEIAVLTPYSVTQGGNLELAEIPGYGPILPSTARELLPNADSLRRVVIDAGTGDVICVDDKVPGPGRRRPAEQPATPPATTDATHHTDTAAYDPDATDEPDEDGGAGGPGGGSEPTPDPHDSSPAAGAPEPEPERERAPAEQSFEPLVTPIVENDKTPVESDDPDPPDPGVSPDTLLLLQRLAARQVIAFDLDSAHYTVPGRLRRYLQLRDRTCTFPGCHVPGKHCDVDHREPWPRGRTSEHNCHCLCRRHHRAKQHYFTVTLDTATGDTLWTTPDGRSYRRPPPRW